MSYFVLFINKFYSLPNDNNLNGSKIDFADNKSYVAEMMCKTLWEQGENAQGYQHFIHFDKGFQKPISVWSFKKSMMISSVL